MLMKGLRISAVMRGLYAGVIVLSAVSGATLYFADRAIESERAARERQAELKNLGASLARASSYLTGEARAYAVTGKLEQLKNYRQEIDETKTIERVVERLSQLVTDPDQVELIGNAKSGSDALIAIEEKVLNAVDSGDLMEAQDLMFGPPYDAEKAKVTDAIGAFQESVNSRAEQEVEEIAGFARLMTLAQEVSGGLTALAFLVTLFLFGRRVVRPLNDMAGALNRLASGDETVEVPHTGRRDEIGDMAGAAQAFQDAARERAAAAERQRRQAEADAAQAERLRQATEQFRATVGAVLSAVASASGQLQTTAGSMTEVARKATTDAGSVAASAEEASSNAQSVASSTEELTASIRDVSQQAGRTAEAVTAAHDRAEQARGYVSELQQGSEAVSAVISLIRDIAEQTNLLALNATIEAARAGEMGKGFAVVASEVKNLANQTAKATEEVEGQIQAMQAAVTNAVPAMEAVMQTIEQITGIASSVASTAAQQTAATDEINQGVHHAAAGARDVTSHVVALRKGAESTLSGAEEVMAASTALIGHAEQLKADIDRYIATVQAA